MNFPGRNSTFRSLGWIFIIIFCSLGVALEIDFLKIDSNGTVNDQKILKMIMRKHIGEI